REDLVKAVTSSLKERWPAVVEPLGEQLKEQQMRQTELQDAKKKLDEEEQKLKDSVQEVSAQKAQLETMESELRSFLEAETGQEMDPDKALASLDPDRRQ
ncbi:Tsg101, partial [Symbiodinium sp. KB8]